MSAKAPTARELLDRHNWLDAVELKARVEAVLALHRPVWARYTDDDGAQHRFRACDGDHGQARVSWPCLTVRLLNGEEPKP